MTTVPPYSDESEDSNMVQCRSCGQDTPPDMIEHIDDIFIGQCVWCIRGDYS